MAGVADQSGSLSIEKGTGWCFQTSAPVAAFRANRCPSPRCNPDDWSGAPKITAIVPLMVARAPLEAIPLLDGLHVNWETKAGLAAAGYCQSCAPVTASMA